MAAFEAAVEQGAAGIELDVRLTADQVLVVHHDASLADGGRIREMDSKDLPDWVPTLGAALEASADIWLNIEIKNAPEDPDFDTDQNVAIAVAGLIASHTTSSFVPPSGATPADFGVESPFAAHVADRVLVSSFNVDTVERIRTLDPIIPTGLLVWGQADPASLVARATEHGFDAVHPHDLLVDRSFVDRAHQAGLAINVWTVDDPARMLALRDMGVDAVITNDPELAVRTLSTDD